MTTKNKESTIAGLLALSADKSQLRGECLTSEELALLLEDKIDVGKYKGFMEHLAHCETCYNQWLLLKSEERRSVKKNILPLLSKKSYAYIGSSLAVAASVVVFFNVYDPFRKELVPPPQDAAIFNEMRTKRLDTIIKPAEEKISEQPEQAKAEKAVPAASAKLMQKSTSHGKAEAIIRKGDASAPARAKERLESFLPVDKASVGAKAVEQEKAPARQEFLSMVKAGCGMSEFDPEYWSELESEGERLLSSQSFGQQIHKENFSRLVELLGEMQKESWRQQCDEILRLLKEDI